MSPWHTNCDDPDIFVDGALPRCRNCGKAPSDTEITPPKHTPDPPWTIPPDEPAGKLNLYWPSCVRYGVGLWDDETLTDFGFGWLFDENSPVSQSFDKGNSFDSSFGLSVSSVYPRRLESREFRLICLEAPERPDHPIHLTLETYDRDSCPEYEATSYLWGGEDGDYSPSKPVYIGLHWDILFQTKNCWSMLKYLRPWSGERRVRTVWIDAICINQGDLREREDQVEAMGETYQRSMRLVVYLGDDVVEKRDQDSYPMRRGLEDIGKTQVYLYQLFGRRYFSRVWVIQELVLSPFTIIPFRQVEFRVTHHTIKRLEDLWSEGDLVDHVVPVEQRDRAWRSALWPKFQVPWFGHVATGSYLGNDLCQVLAQTWGSEGTDPRDRIFGILGLLDDKYRGATRQLKPDYSITRAHILIGALAYQLLILEDCAILTEAIGLDAPHPYPSWVPGWIFSSTFTPPDSGYMRNPYPGFHEDQGFFKFMENLVEEYERYHVVLIQEDVEEDMYRRTHPSRRLHPSPTWLQGLAINPSNAGLTVTLVHLLDFDSVELRYLRYRAPGLGFAPGVYHYEITTSSCKLCFSTPKEDLSTVIPADSLQLFLYKQRREAGPGRRPIYPYPSESWP